MYNLFKKIVVFFKRYQIPIQTSDNFLIENVKRIEKLNVESSVELSIEVLKNKNTELIHTVKNNEYDRNLFLYEIGFKNLKRVKEFINTMNTVGNIENFNMVEKYYSKYNLEIFNDEMLAIIKKEFGFKQESNDKFDNYIPDIAIDVLKANYLAIEKTGIVYNLFKKYYQSDSYNLIDKDYDFIVSKIDYLKETLDKKNIDYSYGSYYYKLTRKNLYVCFNNNNKGMVLLEVEPKYYMILSEWSDVNGNKLEKLNFKNFIKTQE